MNTILFVVTKTSFPGCYRSYHVLSVEICRELNLEVNDVFHRIFSDKNEDILERMSLYCESQTLEKHICVHQTLYSLSTTIKEAVYQTERYSYNHTLRMALYEGPFEDEALYTSLKNATRSYRWTGASFTSNKATVDAAKSEIAQHACKELGTQIGIAIIRHLTEELPHDGSNIFNVIFKYIDLNYFQMSLIKAVILFLITLILGPIGWMIRWIVILISGVDLNSDTFRKEVADKMFAAITRNKDKIISDILDNFQTKSLQKYIQFQLSLPKFTENFREVVTKSKTLNTKDKTEHEFKAVAEK